MANDRPEAEKRSDPSPAPVRAVPSDAGQLQTIIDSAMDAIITIDESHHIVMFNKAAERIFGVPASEAFGGTLDRFLPERHRKAHGGHIRAFGTTGETTRAMGRLGRLTGLRADGAEFPIEASISQADVGGRHLFTVILRDISERERLEAQLLQAQKMEGIGRLAGGVAHDFNNMLMAIFNYLELALRRLEPGHPAHESLSHIKEAADRAAGLTRQLLAFARKQPAKPTTIRPSEIIANLESMLRQLIGEDLKFKTTLAPDTGCVRADPSQLEQVILNLTVNARDATRHGGALAIESRNVFLDEEYCRSHVGATPGPHVLIAVTDSGAGMTPDVLTRIFEPFFTTKPLGKGTGLGLSICHGIIKQSGGHIAVYSEPGRGTSVKVFLPRVPDAQGAPEAAEAAPAAPRGSETILVAEDSALIRELIVHSLRESGYTVVVGRNGKEALSLAEAHPAAIDLVVTDVVMPELSGVQLVGALRQARPALRAIYLSGYTEETIEHHGVETDSVFLAKPFIVSALLNTMRRILDTPRK